MISLRKENRYLKLFPGTTIPWEIENDLLDYDFIGQSYSWPWELPREGNEFFFDFAGDADSPVNGFKVYDGFEVCFNNNVWWRCSLELLESFGATYQVQLSVINSQLDAKKATSIRELVTAELAYDFAVKAAWDHTASDRVVFPVMWFYNDYQVTLLNPANLVYMCPWFQILYVLKEALKPLGYTLVNNAVAYNDDMFSAILCTTQAADFPVSGNIAVAEWLPEMTLAELISDCQVLFACDVVVDPDAATVELRSLNHMLKREAVDVTDYLDEAAPAKKAPFTDVVIGFNTEDDALLAQTPETLIGRDRGTFDQVSDFDSLVVLAENDYAFIRAENAIYKAFKSAGQVFVDYYCEALQKNATAAASKKELTLKLMPVMKTKYVYLDLEAKLEIRDPGVDPEVFIRGEGFENWLTSDGIITLDFFGYLTTAMEVKFIEEGGSEVYPRKWHTILAIDYDDHWIKLGLDYTDNRNVSRVIFRLANDFYAPILGTRSNNENSFVNDFYAPTLGRRNPTAKRPGYVSIFHGRQEGISGAPVLAAADYPYASADPYNSQLAMVGEVAIRATEENSLLKTTWQALRSFLQSTRLLKLTGRLSETMLRNLSATGIGRWKGGTFVFTKSSCQLTEDGLSAQEIEAYRI